MLSLPEKLLLGDVLHPFRGADESLPVGFMILKSINSLCVIDRGCAVVALWRAEKNGETGIQAFIHLQQRGNWSARDEFLRLR